MFGVFFAFLWFMTSALTLPLGAQLNVEGKWNVDHCLSQLLLSPASFCIGKAGWKTGYLWKEWRAREEKMLSTPTQPPSAPRTWKGREGSEHLEPSSRNTGDAILHDTAIWGIYLPTVPPTVTQSVCWLKKKQRGKLAHTCVTMACLSTSFLLGECQIPAEIVRVAPPAHFQVAPLFPLLPGTFLKLFLFLKKKK